MGLCDQLAALAAVISGRPHERIPTPRPHLCWKSAADYALPPAAELYPESQLGDTATCPGRSAARSDALLTRDRTSSMFLAVPDQQCTAQTRAALPPGHESASCESKY